ncbi:class I tRNA ligase family protein [Streptomyces sp. A7024]|uniref:methionine--tRNA ligase n=1 Tax=Streptomyces coryli TaxID=1128680 RepID=A0A6G4TXC3_9ACTN|nr:class I tRNA ligase family protein [Streptomyces coryli]NGN64170.1 class I tRNA ligase family protein [Streptomyces coryli]
MTRHLITSALPYINGTKHLGNLVGSMLPADVYARYLRLRGEEVLFLCATDEHGTPAELAAKAAGLPVDTYCARQHDAQKAIYAGFDLSFDHFGRSSSTQNTEITQHFARCLHDQGFIEQRAVDETAHLFLLQSKLQHEIEEFAHTWLVEGLPDRAITLDLDWGVPVPADIWPELAADGKVFHGAFDAPIEYIGATKEWAERAPADRDWESWWYDAEDVRYTQFMGKDNLPTHAVMFPAIQLGTGEPWKTVDFLKAFGGLKCRVSADTALEVLPADYWRYYLMATVPESDDSSFTWEHFAATVNKDLADTLGNFVHRVLSFSRKSFGDAVPGGGAPGAAEERLGAEIAAGLAEYEEHLEALRFRKATAALRALWSAGNAYVDQKAPWREIRTDPEAAAVTLRTAMMLIELYGRVCEPVVPATARSLAAVFGSGRTSGWPTAVEARALNSLPPGTEFSVPPVLFSKVGRQPTVSSLATLGTPWEFRANSM